jgi:hypothetical protein
VAQIYINNNASIDIYETDGLYAEILLFDTCQTIGPAYDMAALNRTVFDFIQYFMSSVNINESQKLQVSALQDGLVNCQLEESDYFESF